MADRYEYLAHLIANYLRQELTAREQLALDAWLAERAENRKFLEELEDAQHLQQKLQAFHGADRERIWALTEAKLADYGFTHPQRPIRRISRWLPYAAALLVGVAAVAWFFFDKQPDNKYGTVNMQVADIPPGGNRATLTLADGRTMTLDEARDGIVIGSGEITYNDGNPLADGAGIGEGQGEVPLLELSTPKGGTYQITLPDGTRVWLNAASTLKYPPRFSGAERIVELTGEAYFSVVKDTDKPFKVVSAEQEVQVLGTEFNVSAYPDEKETKTTLVEGAVRLSYFGDETIDLSPGEQGVLQQEGIKKINVHISTVTAWKFGRFSFDHKTFVEIMNEMARWYDIDIEYEGSAPDNRFIGDAYRTDNLRTVIRFLDGSNIKHRLDRDANDRYRLVITNGKEVTD